MLPLILTGTLTACTIYVDVINPCTTGTTFTSDVVVEGNTWVERKLGVGMGTTTPNEKLTVVGSISATTNVHIGGNFIADGASSNDLDLRVGGTTAILLKSRGNQNSYIGNDSFVGNVGIGTTKPNEKLTVVGSISGTTDLYIDGRIEASTVKAASYNSTTSVTGYQLNGVKFLWRDGGADLQVGNTSHKTDIIGTNIDCTNRHHNQW